MTENKTDTAINLTESLSKLEEISNWFDEQAEVDVELGLTKIKEAAKLITDSKSRLADIENEFNEIERVISTDSYFENSSNTSQSQGIKTDDDKPIDLSEIPF